MDLQNADTGRLKELALDPYLRPPDSNTLKMFPGTPTPEWADWRILYEIDWNLAKLQLDSKMYDASFASVWLAKQSFAGKTRLPSWSSGNVFDQFYGA